MALEVLSTGPMTTVQDLGRRGFGSKGYRRCGACDKYAMRISNLLAWNLARDDDSPVLEFTLFGGRIRFGEKTLIALAGADMEAKLDGKRIPMYQTVAVKAGQILELGAAKNGLRTYLAVNGGLDVPKVMGSCSTDTVCKIGGLEGSALRAGDRIELRRGSWPWKDREDAEKAFEYLKEKKVEFTISEDLYWLKNASFRCRCMGQELIPVLRMVAGPQEEAFTEESMETLRRSVYRVGADSNRMACRLTGPRLEARDGYDIVSDGIVEGSVQVSANGQPIIMLADHQTTGGYAKIGTVISADIPAIAQRRPGESIGFLLVSPSEANEAYRTEEKKLAWLRGKLLTYLSEYDVLRDLEIKYGKDEMNDFNRFKL